jgi:hypothetical protein
MTLADEIVRMRFADHRVHRLPRFRPYGLEVDELVRARPSRGTRGVVLRGRPLNGELHDRADERFVPLE